jgi:hypothetical protein
MRRANLIIFYCVLALTPLALASGLIEGASIPARSASPTS